MIEFRPRLITFYVILFVTIALLSNRVTISKQTASAQTNTSTMVDRAQ